MAILKNRKLLLLIKTAVLICCFVFARTLLCFSASAKNFEKLKIETVFQDTLDSIRGKIVDSKTNAPIPFVSITFYNEDTLTLTIVSDENGEFSRRVLYKRSKIKLSAIGYQEHTSYLASDHTILLRLKPVENLLPNVVVSSKGLKQPNAKWIIKKVKKHFEQNYGDISFDQRFKVYSTAHNYDTLKGEFTDQLIISFNKEQNSSKAKNWHRDTAIYNKSFFNIIGTPKLVTGNIIPYSDFLRKGLVIGEKQSNKFEFKLLSHYQDKKYGSVYHVSFKPQNNYNEIFLFGYVASFLPLGYLKGEMLVSEVDYAVVKIKYIWELKTERINASLEKSFHSLYWKADKQSKIVSSSIINMCEYSYNKDIISGKYYIQTIKSDCHDTGYQIENKQKMQLYYQFDVTSLGISNIVK